MACGDNLIVNNPSLGYPSSPGNGTFTTGDETTWNLLEYPSGTILTEDANRVKITTLTANNIGALEFYQVITSTFTRYKIEAYINSDSLNTFNHEIGLLLVSVNAVKLSTAVEEIRNPFTIGVGVDTSLLKYTLVFYFTSSPIPEKIFRVGVLSTANAGVGTTSCYLDHLTLSEVCPLTVTPIVTGNEVEFTVSGGEGPYYYRREWDGGEGITDGTGVTISGLSPGNYSIRIVDKRLPYIWSGTLYNHASAFNYAEVINFNIASECTVSATVDVVNVTTYGGSDGSITINATGLDGATTYILYYPDGSFNVNGPVTPNVYPNLPAGIYSIEVKTAMDQCVFELDGIEVTEAVEVAAPFVHYPISNSLRFVEATTVNNCSTFQTDDNTLFFSEYHPGIRNRCYYQKVCKCDPITLQWQSNFEDNFVELTHVSTGTITTVTASTATLPDDYVLPEDYTIIEAELDFSGLASGIYSVRIYGEDEDLGEYELIGEPILLKTAHENTNLIRYSNVDQAFDIEYLTGIEHRIRVESRFFERSTGGKRSAYLDDAIKLTNLKEYVTRVKKLDTFMLPTYLHEKISLALAHDTFIIGAQRWSRTDDGYKWEYLPLHPLQNGSVELQLESFNNNNSDDIGIDTNEGFLEGNNGGLLKY